MYLLDKVNSKKEYSPVSYQFKSKPANFVYTSIFSLWRSACGFSGFNNKNAEITKRKEITQRILCINVVIAGQCSSLLLTLAKKKTLSKDLLFCSFTGYFDKKQSVLLV